MCVSQIRACSKTDFIEDISGSYLEWVDYYKLPEDEDKKRRNEIAAIIEKTNTWLAKVPTSIKAIDIIMNDLGVPWEVKHIPKHKI